jgi:hypothetical protein
MTDEVYLRRERRRVLRLGLVVALVYAAIHVSGLSEGVLYLAPALLLLVLLIGGHYPGEALIERLARRGARPRRRLGALHVRPRRTRGGAPAGGLLIALALAGRAPPVAS